MNNKKILIIQLRRFGDILASGHLLGSIKAQNPRNEVSFLVFEEFKNAARILSPADHIYTINRRKIELLAKNRIYNTAFAINQFMDDLSPLLNCEWDEIINLSNDKTSTYLSSYFSTRSEGTKQKGIRFGLMNQVEYSNKAAILLNDVIPCFKEAGIHLVEVFHKLAGYKIAQNTNLIRFNDEHTKTAFSNLRLLRERESHSSNDVKIIGIQLAASTEDKEIGLENICDLIELLLDSVNYYPVLMIAPIDIERSISNEINTRFNNTLVTIEADWQALPSVLVNLDAVVTPDTSIKHLCDLCDTPVVEIIQGSSPGFLQSSINKSSISLTPSSTHNKVASDDIFSALSVLFGQATSGSSEGKAMAYTSRVSENSDIDFFLISPTDTDLKNYKQQITRNIIRRVYFDSSEGLKFTGEIINISRRELYTWIEKEKESTSEVSRVLLGTLRNLLQTKEDITKAPLFISNLEKLLNSATEKSLSALATIKFRANLESMTSRSLMENIRDVEALLYELKADLQAVATILKDAREEITRNKISPIKEMVE